MVYLTRKSYFSAAHRYHNSGWDDETNRKVFGKCNYPHGHGHNYVLEVTVRGDADPDTGMVINLTDLDGVIKTVLDQVDHRHLNHDVDRFKEVIPTTENLTVWLWERLADRLGDAATLHHLRLFEDESLFVDYTGPEE